MHRYDSSIFIHIVTNVNRFFLCIFLGNDTLFAGNESVIVPMVYEARAVWGIVNANTDFLNRLQKDDYIKLSLFATFECFV